MKIIPRNTFKTTPWKNNFGVTHEIDQNGHDGRYSWRFSLAEVTRDGTFSVFPSLQRVLTVVQGAGMDLKHSNGVIPARPLQPVSFEGDLPIDGQLVDGPILNYNLIFDPKIVQPAFTVISSPKAVESAVPAGGHACLFVVTGEAEVNGQLLQSHSFAISEREQLSIRVDATSRVILTDLIPVSD